MSQLGIAPVVTITKAPKHYGIILLDWDEGRDQGFDVVIDNWEELERCRVIRWYIHKVSKPPYYELNCHIYVLRCVDAHRLEG